jgi:uncharacterized protein (DUF1684 family)
VFRDHPQTPLEDDARSVFSGLEYFPYDPDVRVVGAVEPEASRLEQLPASSRAPIGFYRIGRAAFALAGAELTQPHNPSCSYSPRWSCPLPQADSRLPVAVRAGERHR